MAKQTAQTALSFEDLLKQSQIDDEYHPLPAPFKGGIRVRPLSIKEINQINRDCTRGKVVDNELVSMMLIEKAVTAPVMDRAKVEALAANKASLYLAILRVANRVNGLDDKAEEAAKDSFQEGQEQEA